MTSINEIDPTNDHGSLRVRDTFVIAQSGGLFVRIWEYWSTHQENVPILLFHDSLGSVDIWRGFPSKLAIATRRTVIAYDRLLWPVGCSSWSARSRFHFTGTCE